MSMRFGVSLLKYLGLFIVVCLLTVLASTVALSYYAAQQLSHIVKVAPESEPNVVAVLEISNRYVNEIREFESFMGELKEATLPPFCTTLCKPSSFNKERYHQDRISYLQDFFDEHGKAALKDPEFQMRIKELGFIRRSIPSSARTILAELYAGGKPNTFMLTLQIENALLAEAPFILDHYEALSSGLEKLDFMRKIGRACTQIPNPESLQKECEDSRLDAF